MTGRSREHGRRARRWVAVPIALTVATVAAGCGGSSSSSGTAGTSTGAAAGGGAASSASFTLRVGDIMSFTGDLGSYGPSLDAAARLSAKYIDETLARQGLSKRLSVRVVDSQDDQTKIAPAVEAANKLANLDKVNVIVGTISSGSTIAVAQSVSVPKGILQITPTSDAPAIPAVKDKNLLYQMLPLGTLSDKAMLDFVAKSLGRSGRLNVGWRNDAWGNSVSAPFIASWKKNGGSIGQAVSWDPSAPNFDTEAQKLAKGAPDGWVIFDFPPTYAKVAPALVRAGGWSPAKTFVTAEMRDASVLQKLGGPSIDGLRGVSPSSAGGATPLQKAFNRLFAQREKGKPITGYEGPAFDAVMVAFLAALAAGSPDGPKIASRMQQVAGPPGKVYTYQTLGQAIAAIRSGQDINFEGVSGPLDFDSRGAQRVARFDIWTYTGSATKTVKTFAVSTG